MKKFITLISAFFLIFLGMNAASFASEDEILNDFMGTYRGWYYATQGHTGLTLDVYLNDEGAYEATFNFYSVPENPSVPSGEYLCDVLYDAANDSYQIIGREWINRPSTYEFVDLRGQLEGTIYKGDVIAYNRTFSFELTKQIGSNETSGWANETVNLAIIKSFVPLELQSDYKSEISRADFARLTIAAISLKTEMNIEAFMSSESISIKESPFTDTDDLFVTYANSLGIVKGYGNGQYGPDDRITREQAATMLMNLATVFEVDTKLPKTIEFKDHTLFSDWAVDGINFVSNFSGEGSQTKIMSGDNNAFNPKGGYTREQAIITIYRLINALN